MLYFGLQWYVKNYVKLTQISKVYIHLNTQVWEVQAFNK